MQVFSQAKWIYVDSEKEIRNRYAEFRRTFQLNKVSNKLHLHITANSKYYVFVNGQYIGFGPVRAYPYAYKYDTYVLFPYLKEGENVIAVLTHHAGEANMHSVASPPGLLFSITDGEKILLSSDRQTSARDNASLARKSPKVSMQLPDYEEQFDARHADGWTLPDFCGGNFYPAYEIAPANDYEFKNLAPRDIPFLSEKTINACKIVAFEQVESIPYIFSFDVREKMCDNIRNSVDYYTHTFIYFNIHAENDGNLHTVYAEGFDVMYINGNKYSVKRNFLNTNGENIPLHAGNNPACIEIYGRNHGYQKTLCLDGSPLLRIQNFCMIGPLPFVNEGQPYPPTDWGKPVYISSVLQGITEQVREKIKDCVLRGDLNKISAIDERLLVCIDDCFHKENIFARCYTDKTIKALNIPADFSALTDENGYAVIPVNGKEIRLLVDYGGETVGCQVFSCFASEGTIIDFHNFEFIQPNGLKCYAEDMNNAMRYVCREGWQEYRSLLRRGMRYSYITIRNCPGEIRLGNLKIVEITYPQKNRGSFLCSDWQINKIWEAGCNSLRCCSEDTYTDCPTYEQVFWIGDMRNEGLVDWIKNGDSRLWRHSLFTAADSLQISPLICSHLPSGWINIIPNWSFLWQQSVYEYYFYTGDTESAQALFPFVVKNTEGILDHINKDGLFEITAWNFFDWAPMDQPGYGVVTHQNCLAAAAIDYAIKLAESLNERQYVSLWKKRKSDLIQAINRYLWNEEKQAYTDCLYDDGKGGYRMSEVYSQQTHTAALIGGTANGEQLEKCRKLIYDPPESFVKAGSPFFEFFFLEILTREGHFSEMFERIRKDWGFMINAGCDTFWEMWTVHEDDGRMTRSHCHGWSSAPVYFITENILGVKPLEAGYKKVEICPHPADLEFARGTVPTPYGDIRISWKAENGEITSLNYSLPEGITAVVKK